MVASLWPPMVAEGVVEGHSIADESSKLLF
jgi:hypothetical protein